MTSKQYYLQRIASLEDLVGSLLEEKLTQAAEIVELKKPKPDKKVKAK